MDGRVVRTACFNDVLTQLCLFIAFNLFKNIQKTFCKMHGKQVLCKEFRNSPFESPAPNRVKTNTTGISGYC